MPRPLKHAIAIRRSVGWVQRSVTQHLEFVGFSLSETLSERVAAPNLRKWRLFNPYCSITPRQLAGVGGSSPDDESEQTSIA
jgi:hypothetical protein